MEILDLFSLEIRDPWLFYIQTGKKVVEGRKGDEKKYEKWIGKKVYFFNKERMIPVIVQEIRHYEDLYAYLAAEGASKVMPGLIYEEVVDEYHKFYTDEAIKKAGGMLAIQVDINI